MSSHKKNVIISMPEPSEWTFKCFVTEAGRDVTKHWDTISTFEAETAFKAMIKGNRKIKNYMEWPSWRHPMRGKPGRAGVVELGFKASGRQYRSLSMFSGKMCIIILCMAYHKQNVWNPTEAEKIVTERAKLVVAGKAKLNVIEDEDD
jgi:hypothetical protein